MPIFSESTLRKLDRLALVASQVRAGVFKGERRSTKRGTSIEFADYRNYVQGDDLRRIDWNVYARLEKPFIKLLEEEEDLAVHIICDASRSMDFGATPDNPSTHKFTYACQLAAALGYIALAAGDRLTLTPLQADTRLPPFGPARGRANALRLLAYLDNLSPAGVTRLDHSLRHYAHTTTRPGLLFALSDLFSPEGFMQGLTQLQGRGFEVVLIHLLAPEERDPQLSGDLRLLDSETGAPQEVSLDAGLRALYRKRLAAWQDDLEQWCARRQITYLPLDTATPWDTVVLQWFRRRGLVK